VRDDFGGFTHGLTADDIRRGWSTFDDFAREVIRYVRGKATW
jgi:hypothetical protein